MRKRMIWMGFCLFLLCLWMGIVSSQGTGTTATAPSQPLPRPPLEQCCIAGEYKGYHEDIPSKSCPKPEKGDFKMIIYQDKGCGSKIWGKIMNPDGTIQDFTGTVIPGRGGCCDISGGWSKPPSPGFPGERTVFKGFLCKKVGKWVGEGEYRTTRVSIVCNGKWKLAQM